MLITVLFVLGFVALIKGAGLLVDGSASVAKKLKISNIVIGLTIVSFGTSAPELLVNLFATGSGETELAIANVFGSNISNVLLILGVSALIYPLAIKKNTVWKEIPFSLLAALLVGVLANDLLIDKMEISVLSRIDGLVLFVLFIIFIYYTFGIAKIGGKDKNNIKEFSTLKSIIFIVIGLVGLTLGGKWIINGAIHFAELLGLSKTLVGLTIVAIGTSLPELATSAVAAYKKNAEIAIGNIVGSNIFNLLWVLGISATVAPLAFQTNSNVDLGMVILSSFLLFIFIFIGKRRTLERWQGAIFILTYISYITFAVIRG
ncbi:MAG: calcium/sodium antiporter [Patescibacteria group bacterium]|nr:calcium/sodium antiporter [Patescibacteria group bacterium]